jgi:hypothetical protein
MKHIEAKRCKKQAAEPQQCAPAERTAVHLLVAQRSFRPRRFHAYNY